MRFTRILVAVDASRESMAALAAAASLASRLDAELHALFVEDIELLRLAGFSFARELGHHSGASRRLDSASLEATMKGMAAEARATIAVTARRLGIRWTFEVSRGSVAAQLLAAAGGADLVALGMASRGTGQRRRLGSTARRVLESAGRSVLLFHGHEPIHGPVLLVIDGEALSHPSLAGAVRLAEGCDEAVIPLIVAREPAAARRLEEAAREALGAVPPRWRAPRAVDARGGGLMRALREAHPGIVVFAVAGAPGQAELMLELIDQVECPLLIVK